MAKAKVIVISPLAEHDIDQIWLYTFKTWSEMQADKYLDELYEGFKEIANERAVIKSIGHVVKGYWQCRVNHHYVIFKQTDQHVNIIRVLHKKMDWSRNLQ